METDNQQTAISSATHVGAGVLTCPAERSSANVASTTLFEVIPSTASSARRPGRGGPGLGVIVVVVAVAFALSALAQTGKTVRHHKVAVEDPSSPPELIQAESAIEKQDLRHRRAVTEESRRAGSRELCRMVRSGISI